MFFFNSPTNYFSNITYPEPQQAPSSYSKLNEIQKFDHFQNHKLSIDSNDPIISNLNSTSLTDSDQLDIINPTDLSSIENDLNTSQCQYNSYGFPFKEDNAENGYSTFNNYQFNKKTVYEVVV